MEIIRCDVALPGSLPSSACTNLVLDASISHFYPGTFASSGWSAQVDASVFGAYIPASLLEGKALRFELWEFRRDIEDLGFGNNQIWVGTRTHRISSFPWPGYKVQTHDGIQYPDTSFMLPEIATVITIYDGPDATVWSAGASTESLVPFATFPRASPFVWGETGTPYVEVRTVLKVSDSVPTAVMMSSVVVGTVDIAPAPPGAFWTDLIGTTQKA